MLTDQKVKIKKIDLKTTSRNEKDKSLKELTSSFISTTQQNFTDKSCQNT